MYPIVIGLEKHQDEYKPKVIMAGQHRLKIGSRTIIYYVKPDYDLYIGICFLPR